MRINSIEISNYRQYKSYKYEFPKSGTHDLHMIIGQSTMGKTNLLNAITWCLYGTEPHLGGENKVLPILNIDAKREAEYNGIKDLEVSVKIWAEDDDQLIVFQRKTNVNVSNGFLTRETLAVTITDQSGNAKVLPENQSNTIVDKYLPERIRKYFFFDGEQLDRYFIGDQGSRIKDAIRNISKVDLLTRMSERLKTVIADKQQEAGRMSKDIRVIEQEKENFEKEVDNLVKDITIVEDEIKKSEEIIQINTEKLQGQENVPELENRRKSLEEEQVQLEKDRKAINKETFKFITDYKIFLTFFPYIQETLDVIIEKEENRSLPPNIDKDILIKAIEEQKCTICEQNLDQSSLEKVHLLLSSLQVSSATSHTLLEIKSELKRAYDDVVGYPEKKESILSKIKSIESSMKKVGDNLQEIDNQLNRFSDRPQIIQWNEERNKHKELLKRNIQRLGMLKAQKDIASENLDLVDRKLNKAIASNKACQNISNLVGRAKSMRKIVDSTEVELMDEVRLNMKNITMKYFNRLNWMHDLYDRIELNDRYQLDLIHKEGYSCVEGCAAAERALLAIAFTISLHEVSGFKAPLIIDTPFSRIADENKTNFAQVLTEVTEGKQIILALTTSEYSPDVEAIMAPFASSSIVLNTKSKDVNPKIINGDYNGK